MTGWDMDSFDVSGFEEDDDGGGGGGGGLSHEGSPPGTPNGKFASRLASVESSNGSLTDLSLSRPGTPSNPADHLGAAALSQVVEELGGHLSATKVTLAMEKEQNEGLRRKLDQRLREVGNRQGRLK